MQYATLLFSLLLLYFKILFMSHPGRLYLVCYDISDPRRLSQVARFMEHHAVRVQYSVFAAELTPSAVIELRMGILTLLRPNEDDVRFYPLPRRARVAILGQQMFPDDVLLIRDGHNLLQLGITPHCTES